MGEMADFANEFQEATMEQLFQYQSGEMTLEEAYEAGIIDELGGLIQYE